VPEFTDNQILEAINQAIRDRELGVIPGLVKTLALQAPDKAKMALELMQLGAELSRQTQEPSAR
jgi:hypothetical protein